MMGEIRTRENGAHCVIAHENPVSVMSTVAPVTFDVKLKVRRMESSIRLMKRRVSEQLKTHKVPTIQIAKSACEAAQSVARCNFLCHHRFPSIPPPRAKPPILLLRRERGLTSAMIIGARKLVASATRAE